MTHYKYLLPSILGAAHFCADFMTGFLLLSLLQLLPIEQVAMLIITYNIIAFALQPLVGYVVDKSGSGKLASIVGVLLLLLGMSLVGTAPTVAIVSAGIGSSLFHVGGGGLAIASTPNKASAPGVFAAPGAIGLALGGAVGFLQIPLQLYIVALLIPLLFAIGITPSPKHLHLTKKEKEQLHIHELLTVLLLFAIAARSFVWTFFQAISQQNIPLLLWMAGGASLGKMLGGFLSDRIGWMKYGGIALALSIPLLMSPAFLPGFIIGLALLQSTTPLTVAAMGQLLPRLPSLAAGLALGLGLAIGGIPFIALPTIIMSNIPPVVGSILALLLLVITLIVLKKKIFVSIS